MEYLWGNGVMKGGFNIPSCMLIAGTNLAIDTCIRSENAGRYKHLCDARSVYYLTDE
jgi:hypothetical protein